MLPAARAASSRGWRRSSAILRVALPPRTSRTRGEIATDYSYYVPRLYDGELWLRANGPFALPWFTPSFCGGLPAYPNPQSAYYALPQLLDFALGPVAAIHATVLVFAAIGFAGFYALVRDVFGGGLHRGRLRGALFALDGFYLRRMVAGHIGFHPFMLVPLVAWAVLVPAGGEARALFARSTCVAGAAIAYAIEAGALQHLPAAPRGVVAIGARARRSPHGREVARRRAPSRRASRRRCSSASRSPPGRSRRCDRLLAHSPRALYPIPGAQAGDLVDVCPIPLLSRPADGANGAIVNTSLGVEHVGVRARRRPAPLDPRGRRVVGPVVLAARGRAERLRSGAIARGLGWGFSSRCCSPSRSR